VFTVVIVRFGVVVGIMISVIVVVSRVLLGLHGLLSGIASSGCLFGQSLCCSRDGCGAIAPCTINM
jgi:hypothetical protein